MAEADVRSRILAAATTLFANKGYGSTSVREVVEAAGVTKPTLYYHFGSKDTLFLRTVHHHLDHFTALVEAALAEDGSVRERLTRFAHRYASESSCHPDAVKLLITVKQPTDAEQPAVDVTSIHQQHARLIGRIVVEGIGRGELRPDLDPAAVILALIGPLHLLIMARLYGHDVPDEQIDRLLDLFFHGAAA